MKTSLPRRTQYWRKGPCPSSYVGSLRCGLALLIPIMSGVFLLMEKESLKDWLSDHQAVVQESTTRTSTPTRRRRNWNYFWEPTLYICGFTESDNYRLLFPRHLFLDINTPRQKTRVHMIRPLRWFFYTSRDVLMIYGWTKGPGCQDVWSTEKEFHRWVRRFPGKTVIFNAEARDMWTGPVSQRLYKLGAYPDGPQTLRYRFVQTTLLNYGPSAWEKVFLHSLKPKSTKERFMIYAATNCVAFRDDAARKFSEIEVVDQAGRCPFNVTAARFRPSLPELQGGHHMWMGNARKFGRYRFCLVLENELCEGYVTEKILNAFLGGCIPIYYGSTEVFDIFNRQAFIYYDINNSTEAMERVRYLQGNATAYDQIMNQPILAHGAETIETYFTFTERIGNATLLKRIHHMMGLSL